MKFRIEQANFTKTLLAAGRSVHPKANLPVLSNVLISTKANKLEVVSTNLETATKVTTACKSEVEGKTTVVGRSLLEFVSQLPEGEVVFELLGEEAVISTKGFNARIPTIAAEEFPAIPKIEQGKEIKIEASDLVRAVSMVAFCASGDEGRPILTGILCEFNKGKLSMVATDGYRLSFNEVAISASDSLPNLKIVVPAKALVEVAKLVMENPEEASNQVKMVIAEGLNQINFMVGNIEFTSRLIEGEFPSWQKIIPSTFTTKAKLPKNEFTKLIRIASIFARDSGNIVKLKFTNSGANKKGVVAVAASAQQVGSSDSQVETSIVGRGGEIAFNFRYLLEVLSVIEDEEVNFEMIESLNPGRITVEGEKDSFFHIIMPVRLQS